MASHRLDLARRWQLAALARALTPRVLCRGCHLCHLEKGDEASFKIRGEEGRYRSDSLKIKMVG
jgi:hypothetical protein